MPNNLRPYYPVMVMGVVIIAIEIIVVGVSIDLGRPVRDLVAFLGLINGLGAPLVTAVIQLVTNSVKIDEMRGKITDVQNQTNGHMTALMQKAGINRADEETDKNND